jgi:hypothetical protein
MTANPASLFAIQFRMPAGIPGTISRDQNLRSEAAVLSAVTGQTPTGYGQAVVIDATTAQMRLPTPADAKINGWLIRPYPTISAPNQPVLSDYAGAAVPLGGTVKDQMTAGYMSVLLSGTGTPARGSQVYVWVAASTGSHVQGGPEMNPSWGPTTTPKNGNTGNGVFTVAPSAGAMAAQGNYALTMLTPTTFQVISPNGNSLPNGATGVAYINPEIAFTLAAGSTAFVAGDAFTIAMTPNALSVLNCYFTGAADANGNTEIAFKMN